MGGFANDTRKALLDHYFGKSTLTPPTIYVGFSSTTPTASGGNVTEPSGGAYARKQTAAADWNVATSADPAVISNANALTWAAATADWAAGADLTYGVLYDAASGGNCLGFGKLTTAKKILNDDIAQIGAGALQVTLATTADV